MTFLNRKTASGKSSTKSRSTKATRTGLSTTKNYTHDNFFLLLYSYLLFCCGCLDFLIAIFFVFYFKPVSNEEKNKKIKLKKWRRRRSLPSGGMSLILLLCPTPPITLVLHLPLIQSQLIKSVTFGLVSWVSLSTLYLFSFLFGEF